MVTEKDFSQASASFEAAIEKLVEANKRRTEMERLQINAIMATLETVELVATI